MKITLVTFLCLLLPTKALPVQGGVSLTSLGGQVDALAAHLLRCRRLPGLTVAVARATSGGGRQVLTRAYGVADVATNRTVDTNTRFCLAGNTQSFTAATLAQLLHENDSFSLDSTIQSMLGGWFQLSSPTRSRRVTVRDILSHRVGLAPYFGGVVLGYNLTRPELIRRLRHVPVMAPFRHSFVPNPLLYVVAGHLVQMINGTFWENVVTRRIFKPLHMTGSTFADRVPNWANNFALPHVLRDGILIPISSKVTGNVLRPVGPSSSICSTAPDMAEWMLTLLRNGTSHGDPVLDPQVIAELFQPQNTNMPGKSNRVKGKLPVDSTTNAYSLGWFSGSYRGHKRIFQNGFANYYGSFTTLFPDLGLGIFTAANGPSLAGMDNAFRALHYSITDLALGEKPWINETTACTFPKPWLVANVTKKESSTVKEKSETKALVTSTETTVGETRLSKENKTTSTMIFEVTSVESGDIENLNTTAETLYTTTSTSILNSTTSGVRMELATILKTTLGLTTQKSDVNYTKLYNEIATTVNFDENDAVPLTTLVGRQSTAIENVTGLKIDGLTTVSVDDSETKMETEEDDYSDVTSHQVLTSAEDDETTDVSNTSTAETEDQSTSLKEDETSEVTTEFSSKTESNATFTTNLITTSEFTTTEEPDPEIMDIFDDSMFGVRLQTSSPVKKYTVSGITSTLPSSRTTIAKKTLPTTTDEVNSVTSTDIFTKLTTLPKSVLANQNEAEDKTPDESEITTKENILKTKENTISGDIKFSFTSPRPIFRRPTQPAWRRRTRIRNKSVTEKSTSALDDLVMEMARLPSSPQTTLPHTNDFDYFILTNPVNKFQETSTVRESALTFFSDVSSTSPASTDIGLLEVMETYPPLPEQTMPKLATVLTSGQFPIFESQKTTAPPTKTTSVPVTWSKNHPSKSNSFSLGGNNLRPEFPSVFWAFNSFSTPPLPTPKPRRMLLPSRRRLSNRHRQLRRSTIFNHDSNQTTTTTTPVLIQDDITETLLKFGVRHQRIKKRDVNITTTNPFPNHVGKYTNKFFGDIVIFFNRTSNTLQMEYGFYGKAQLIPRAQNNTFLLRFFSAVWYVSEADDSKRLPRSVFLVYFKGTSQDGQPERFIVPLFDPRMPPIFSRVST